MKLSRLAALVRIYREMRDAHSRRNDVELSDWLSGIVVPLVAYVVTIGSGLGFLFDVDLAFTGVAIASVIVLFTGIFGAWELMMWLALSHARTKPPPDA